MTEALNIIFEDFGICCRIEFSCLYFPLRRYL